jgi:TfoX/Sxy family transcriptional regulator of competence genes
MSLQPRGQQQPGVGSGASWAQRSWTAEPTSVEQHQDNEQRQVELAMRKHEQTTEATQRAARVRVEHH